MDSCGKEASRFDLLGVPVDTLSRSEMEAWLRATLLGQWDGRCRHLVTLNPEYVMAARDDAAFAEAIRKADLVVADGVGVILAARLLHGARLPRLTGVELSERLANLGAELSMPVFLLGAGPGVAREAVARLSARIIGAWLAGAWDGATPSPADDDAALDRIRQSGARVVLVAFGAAGQVGWIDRNGAVLGEAGVRLAVGIGGALDFLSGRVPRAPGVIRRLGLEWLYRLGRQPWRWRRQLALPRFMALVLLAAARGRLRRP